MAQEIIITSLLDRLKEQGYTYDFFKSNNCIYCKSPELNFHPHELKIEEVFRLREPGLLPGCRIVYTIESDRVGVKGLLVHNY